MAIIRYLIFLVFNHYYKDGNYKKDDMPYLSTTLAIMGYEVFVFLIIWVFLEKCIDFSLVNNILKPLDHIVYGWGMFFCVLMYPGNYYFLVKKRGLDRIYDEFKNNEMDTKRNRIIGYTCLILYWPIMIGVGGHLKYWFP